MNKIIILITALLISSTCAMAQKGEKTVGVLAGYTTENQSALAGLFFQYRCSSLLRLSPDCQFVWHFGQNKHISDSRHNLPKLEVLQQPGRKPKPIRRELWRGI